MFQKPQVEEISPLKDLVPTLDLNAGCHYENPKEFGCYHVRRSSLIEKQT
jgi:hypothetical protein